jgi:3-hydroxyisobutyrate dehydrogenase-like beta-hydroxyacid dehydrogenase
MTAASTLGFIGLGVMGAPMCRNLARKSGLRMVAYDARPEPREALAGEGIAIAPSAADVARQSEIVFLSLPGEPQVRAVCLGPDGLIAHARAGQVIVDTSTCPVPLARELAAGFAARGVAFADAPVARTAQAARDGTLSVMVGGDAALFERLRPLLACVATEVTHCGAVGAGQAVKLMNNMVVAQTVVALAEALAVARASGAVDPRVLFETLAKGSADSFVLRNHGMKSLLPDRHPTEGAFPTTYIVKDLSYAIDLAASAGLTLEQASTTRDLLERTAAMGFADSYYTAVIKAVEASSAQPRSRGRGRGGRAPGRARSPARSRPRPAS